MEPTWSQRDNTWFGSFGASPDAIPHNAMKFKTPLPYLLKPTTPADVLAALDYSKSPVWYNPEEHWLAWIPQGGPTWSDGEDPLAYLFDIRPVPTKANYTLMYGTGSDSDDPMEPKDVFAGYFVEESWQDMAKSEARRLHGICLTLAATTSWYSTNPWTGAPGDVPRGIDEILLSMVHTTEERARRAGDATKRATLSFVGFISWFQSLVVLENTALIKEDKDYVRSLRLNDRAKIGVLYNMSHDLHEANFPHLIKHRVPIHVAWTDEEKKNWCFLRLSPEVWGEYAAVRATKAPEEPITLADLPSGATWKEDWHRSDWFFQNKSAGKRGETVPVFQPTWDYAIVDFHLWGARSLLNPKRIRAYSERFKAAVATMDLATKCTFFRQNPIGVDEPPFDRVKPAEHPHELSDFSLITDNEAIDEMEIYLEPTEVAREQHKNIHAPRPSRPFNSFNGARELAPLDKSLRGGAVTTPVGRRQRGKRITPGSGSTSSYGEAWTTSPIKERLGPITPHESFPPSGATPRQGTSEGARLTSRWAREMASGSHRRSSRSMSPRRGEPGPSRRRSRSLISERTLDSNGEKSDFVEEYSTAAAQGVGEIEEPPASSTPELVVARRDSGEHPFTGPSPVQTWEPGFQTEEQARDAIEAWAPSVVELIPVYGSYRGLVWNREWLKDAVLVCDDERTYWRLKAYAAIFKGFTKFEELLEVAIRMAMPFAVYIKRSDVPNFVKQNISPLDLNTLGALYAPGYVDQPLVWTGPGGGPAVYGQYEGRVGSLLKRPEAIAFVPIGGVCRFVSEVYDEDIVYRYARGPSLQVSEFDEGEARRIDRLGGSAFYTADRVSNSEIYLLLGHIAGESSSADRTLWPTPEVFECESPHMRGYLSEGAHAILSNLRRDIIEKKRYKWRTYSQWKEYFRVGSKRIHEPKSIPRKADFEAGAEMIKRAFPINWLEMEIGNIILPEEFEPHAQRD
ncbi:hypothetical protein B0H13DRAFT_2382333 [Mycena leptocephala]|nr:hypothetical protein B0H13DRAFT_2382333 [Mycena leptocephala]